MGDAPRMSIPSPALVIVSGAPGSGKTTLARLLAAELELPLVARDELKEVLLDTLGAPDREASARLGLASIRLMLRVAERLLDAPGGVRGVVLESNFRRGLSERDLDLLVARATPVLVHCYGDPQVIVRRYRERAERGERHPGHHDLRLVDTVGESLTTGEYDPLGLDVPVLRVDTTVGGARARRSTIDHAYAPPIAQVIAFARRALLTRQ